MKSLSKYSLCYVFPLCLFANLPTGSTIIDGVDSITTSEQTMTVTQTSERAIINWEQFNIGEGYTFLVEQNADTDILLNRVTGTNYSDLSEISGSIQAIGSVYLINPNGIIFHDTASIDVHGLLATTNEIENSSFLNHSWNGSGEKPPVMQFADNANSFANVTFNGQIRTAPNGYVVLIGPYVTHTGHIVAKQGTVILGATTSAYTLDLYGDNLINFSASDGYESLSVSGGQIDVSETPTLLPANNVNIVSSMYNTPEATTAAYDGGTVVFYGKETYVNKSKIHAKSASTQGTGGNILIGSSSNLMLNDENEIDASGYNGGQITLGSVGSYGPLQEIEDPENVGTFINVPITSYKSEISIHTIISIANNGGAPGSIDNVSNRLSPEEPMNSVFVGTVNAGTSGVVNIGGYFLGVVNGGILNLDTIGSLTINGSNISEYINEGIIATTGNIYLDFSNSNEYIDTNSLTFKAPAVNFNSFNATLPSMNIESNYVRFNNTSFTTDNLNFKNYSVDKYDLKAYGGLTLTGSQTNNDMFINYEFLDPALIPEFTYTYPRNISWDFGNGQLNIVTPESTTKDIYLNNVNFHGFYDDGALVSINKANQLFLSNIIFFARNEGLYVGELNNFIDDNVSAYSSGESEGLEATSTDVLKINSLTGKYINIEGINMQYLYTAEEIGTIESNLQDNPGLNPDLFILKYDFQNLFQQPGSLNFQNLSLREINALNSLLNKDPYDLTASQSFEFRNADNSESSTGSVITRFGDMGTKILVLSDGNNGSTVNLLGSLPIEYNQELFFDVNTVFGDIIFPSTFASDAVLNISGKTTESGADPVTTIAATTINIDAAESMTLKDLKFKSLTLSASELDDKSINTLNLENVVFDGEGENNTGFVLSDISTNSIIFNNVRFLNSNNIIDITGQGNSIFFDGLIARTTDGNSGGIDIGSSVNSVYFLNANDIQLPISFNGNEIDPIGSIYIDNSYENLYINKVLSGNLSIDTVQVLKDFTQNEIDTLVMFVLPQDADLYDEKQALLNKIVNHENPQDVRLKYDEIITLNKLLLDDDVYSSMAMSPMLNYTGLAQNVYVEYIPNKLILSSDNTLVFEDGALIDLPKLTELLFDSADVSGNLEVNLQENQQLLIGPNPSNTLLAESGGVSWSSNLGTTLSVYGTTTSSLNIESIAFDKSDETGNTDRRGIYVDEINNLSLSNVEIINADVEGDGAGVNIGSIAGNLIVEDSIFSNNLATGQGGAVYVGSIAGNTTISGTSFQNNVANTGSSVALAETSESSSVSISASSFEGSDSSIITVPANIINNVNLSEITSDTAIDQLVKLATSFQGNEIQGSDDINTFASILWDDDPTLAYDADDSALGYNDVSGVAEDRNEDYSILNETQMEYVELENSETLFEALAAFDFESNGNNLDYDQPDDANIDGTRNVQGNNFESNGNDLDYDQPDDANIDGTRNVQGNTGESPSGRDDAVAKKPGGQNVEVPEDQRNENTGESPSGRDDAVAKKPGGQNVEVPSAQNIVPFRDGGTIVNDNTGGSPSGRDDAVAKKPEPQSAEASSAQRAQVPFRPE